MRCFILHAVLVVAGDCVRAQSVIPLVDIKSVDPTIVIELRYAGATDAAMWHYRGADPAIRLHLHLLQTAMRDAGFDGQPIEWWQFVIADW